MQFSDLSVHGIKLLSFVCGQHMCNVNSICYAAGVLQGVTEQHMIEPYKEEICTDREDFGKCFLYLAHSNAFF